VSDVEDLIIKQAELLAGVANALKGDPEELSAHSHHDLPEVAWGARMRIVELEAELEGRIEDLSQVIVDMGMELPTCRPGGYTESDVQRNSRLDKVALSEENAKLEAENKRLKLGNKLLGTIGQKIKKARERECISFAQWFRSGVNRNGCTEHECYVLWLALQEAK
jgi:hypothetical protein